MTKIINVMFLMAFAVWMPIVSADKPEHAEPYKKTTEKILCQEACDAAQVELSRARKVCSDAQSECAASIVTARETCESACDTTKSDAVKLCGKQDESVRASCTRIAIEAQVQCIKGCRTADTITSECNAVKTACDSVKGAQSAKDQTCRC